MDAELEEKSRMLAEAHVDWLLEMMRPLLIDHMVHGFKHGVECTQQVENECLNLFDKCT